MSCTAVRPDRVSPSESARPSQRPSESEVCVCVCVLGGVFVRACMRARDLCVRACVCVRLSLPPSPSLSLPLSPSPSLPLSLSLPRPRTWFGSRPCPPSRTKTAPAGPPPQPTTPRPGLESRPPAAPLTTPSAEARPVSHGLPWAVGGGGEERAATAPAPAHGGPGRGWCGAGATVHAALMRLGSLVSTVRLSRGRTPALRGSWL